MTFGIDVSRWQGNFNFIQAKAEGVQFAIIKAGGGDGSLYKDGKFEEYYANAKSAGIDVGSYFFGAATTIERAKEEADKFLSILAGKQFEMPVYYDVEGSMLNVEKNLLTDIVLTFCERVEKAGYFTGMYTGEWACNNNLDDNRLKHFAHWIARWAKTAPKLKSGMSVGMWQFGGETNLLRDNKIAGVVCDQDYCYVDYPSAIKSLGLNGFTKKASAILPRIGYGAWNDDVKVIQQALCDIGYRVDVDGIYGRKTEEAMKAFQADHGLPVTGYYGMAEYDKMKNG